MYSLRTFIGLIILLSSISCFASKTEKVKHLPIESFAREASVSQMVMSDNGRFIAFKNVDEQNEDIFVFDLKTNKRVGKVNVKAYNVWELHFIGNDKVIFRASSRLKKIRMDSPYVLYDLKSDSLKPILTKSIRIPRRNNIMSARLLIVSEDNSTAYFLARSKNKTKDLFRVSLTNGDSKGKLVTGGTQNTTGYFLSKQGKVLARKQYDIEMELQSIEVPNGNGWNTIHVDKAKAGEQKSFRGISEDEKTLVFLDRNNDGIELLYSMSLEDGKISGPMFSKQGLDIENVKVNLHGVLESVGYAGFKSQYAFQNAKIDAKVNNILNALPNYSIKVIDHSLDWEKIIFFISGESNSGQFLLYSNNNFSPLSLQRPEFTKATLSQTTEVSYRTRDDWTIPALITMPKQNRHAKSKLPAIVLPHSGLVSYDKNEFNWLAQFFANRGYVVFQPQYRGSFGFGHEHLNQGWDQWGKTMINDIADGMAYLSERGDIDATKICIVGEKYGGYAALAGAAFTPDLYKCAISINGVSDVTAKVLYFERLASGKNYTTKYWKQKMGGEIDEDYLDSISPINHADKIKSPVLLIQGLDSSWGLGARVGHLYEQTYEMKNKLQDRNIEVELLAIKKMSPFDFYKKEHKLEALAAIEVFLEKHNSLD